MTPLEEKARFKARYDEVLAQAAKEYESNEMALRLALRDDYQLWRRQNRLPKPPPPAAESEEDKPTRRIEP